MKHLLMAAALLASTHLFAQNQETQPKETRLRPWNIRVGGGLGQLVWKSNFSPAASATYNLFDQPSAHFAYHAHGQYELPLSPSFYAVPELGFTQISGFNRASVLAISTVDVGAMIGARTQNGRLQVYIGPTLGLIVSVNESGGSVLPPDKRSQFRNTDFRLTSGFDINTNNRKFFIGLRSQIGLSNVFANVNPNKATSAMAALNFGMRL